MTATEVIQSLFKAIENKSHKDIDVILESMAAEVLYNGEMAVKVTEPATINALHDELTKTFNINRRLLQLKHKVPHRAKRAHFFIKAMQLAVARATLLP